MPRTNNKKSLGAGKRKNNGGQRPTLDVSGFLQKMGLPIPRLPFMIGSSKDLNATTSVYPKMVKLDFPIIPQILTLSTGGLVSVLNININLIEEITSIQGLFAEYAIVGARFEYRVNAASTPQGLYLAYISEKDGAVPTGAQALNSPHIEGLVNNTESPSLHRITWMAADYLDMDWTTTASSTDTPIYLKTFASTSTTGTSASTSAQILITGALALCFRGYVN
jgi:hypothetical protein